MWRYFKSKEAFAIIVWYMAISVCLESIPYTVMTVVKNALLVAIFFLYPLYGMIADIWCGRYLMITVGMCIAWSGTILLGTIEALNNYSFIIIPWLIQLAGIGIFQANSLQFGIDQLKDASAEQFSSFVHWYIWAQEVSADTFNWVKIAIDSTKSEYSELIKLLIVAVLVSLAVFSRFLPVCGLQFESQMRTNPYKLIFGVLKFAWNHRQPVRRSAFTFWEEKIPHGIELGKVKYGGPYTNENVEDVKTFFRIGKLLLSLAAFFISRNALFVAKNAYYGGITSQQLKTGGIVAGLIFISLPVHELAIYPFARSLYPGMVSRILLGAIISLFSLCTIAILKTISFSRNINSFDEEIMVWVAIIPSFCDTFGYLVFTISLLEFIVAQSPQCMRGLLIGMYYCIAYCVTKFAAWVVHIPFDKGENSPHEVAYLTVMAAVGIVGVAIFSRVASAYKYRERDEVVNLHVFAETYYETKRSEND